MATIVIHGTMTTSAASAADWWWNSYDPGGFLWGVRKGLVEAGGADDVWCVGGTDVSELEAFANPRNGAAHAGRFLWTGMNQGSFRRGAAKELAHYLNTIAALSPGEPIRILAHSHGCNVVKAASAQRSLSREVWIEQAVFMACPHFVARAGFRGPFPYRLDAGRFGSILNLSSPNDTVQDSIAERLPGLLGPDWLEGAPEAHRTEQDPDAAPLYQSWEIPTEDSGVAAHTAMHGSLIGYLAGLWLAGNESFRTITKRNAGYLPVPSGDHGS